MTEAERLGWIDRLEKEAFGQRRPEEADYKVAFHKLHSLALSWVLSGLPISALVGVIVQSFHVFLGLFCFAYIRGALLAYSVSRDSLVSRWYFSGHATLFKLSAIPPLTTWKALQAAAAGGNEPKLRGFASRGWTDYQTALSAMGRPVPESPILRRGFGDLMKWFSF